MNINDWFAHNGDVTHRINYSLDKNSIVFDVGGYMGDWADTIQSKFGSKVFIFEPVEKYFNKLKNRFDLNENVKIFNYGLACRTEEVFISLDEYFFYFH